LSGRALAPNDWSAVAVSERHNNLKSASYGCGACGNKDGGVPSLRSKESGYACVQAREEHTPSDIDEFLFVHSGFSPARE
jgi:hypothetical protein